MSTVTLVPAAYRCPDHDNVEVVTARVHERVAREAAVYADLTRSTFRVSVTCPGRRGDEATAHTRVCEGTWQRALQHAS
ncbi:hypothetical protein [Microbacterium telephonicum]|uniref:Uncharacterized protein n=1 Tax=Microbacterium telephonicum TaxID=1714841 RepID=A0A498CLN6_9MICO|nr:hypothetical protein [Microbacterium telephonicum]RLK52861.1 hypothetical protein C7474_0822 [Microbacterium telephonicum]